MKKVEVTPADLGEMLACSVRYGMGRMTYVVQDICNMVKFYFPHIPSHWQGIIRRDLREELDQCNQRGKTLGMQVDHDEWVKLLAVIQEGE